MASLSYRSDESLVMLAAGRMIFPCLSSLPVVGFVDFVADAEGVPARLSSRAILDGADGRSGNRRSPGFWVAVDRLERKLQNEVRSRASSMRKPRFDLRRAFAFLDRRRVRKVSLDDLHRTLGELGFCPPPASMMSHVGDRGGSGTRDIDSQDVSAIVRAVYRRLHGVDDVDSVYDEAEDPSRTVERPLQYHSFVRWAAPLDSRL